MISIDVVLEESFDDETQTFIVTESRTIKLEHSLVSLSAWESKWEKPFLGDSKKTVKETIDYIRCMLLGDVDDDILDSLSQKNIDDISDYINSKRTATYIDSGDSKGPSREIITSEVIYHWMISHNIPFECQHWHLNRLMTLIQVCNIKNQPEKKMSKSEIMRRNKELNDARKAKLNTKG